MIFLGNRARPVRRAENLTAVCEPTVWNIWETQHLTNLQASTSCYADSFTFNVFYFTLREEER
jgi:hypothetical protein